LLPEFGPRQSEIDQKQQIFTAWRAAMAADRLDWSVLLLSRDDRAPRTAAFLSGMSIRGRSQTFVCVSEEMERLHELVALGELEKIRLRAQVSELEVEHGNLALQLDEETDDDDDEAIETVEPVNHGPSTGPSELRRLVMSHVPVILQFPPDRQATWPAHVPPAWDADEITRLGHDLVRENGVKMMMVRA
jgi:hypothetical protein